MRHVRSHDNPLGRVSIRAATGLVAWMLWSGFVPVEAGPSDGEEAAPPDTGMVMPGGEEGTVFRTLTVEGEDRIRVEFDRPTLEIDLDPRSAPGLEWNDAAREILDRTQLDLLGPYLDRSRLDRTPYLPRPWVARFASAPVARFRPDLEDVASWRLSIANSKGEKVATFSGEGEPPREIGWDGRDQNGTPVPPGLVYSHALEAFDRAGNNRTFVGEGFELPPYVHEARDAVTFLFSGRDLDDVGPANPHGVSPTLPPILVETISRLNQIEDEVGSIQVQVTARSFDQARSMADGIVSRLSPRILGDPARLHATTSVEPDAPAPGSVAIIAEKAGGGGS